MKKLWKKLFSMGTAAAMVLSLAACGSSPDTGNSTSASNDQQTNVSDAAQKEPAADTQQPAADNSSSSDDPVTIRITWWGGQSRHDYTQKLLDLYTSEHPNITFEAVPSGWDGYFDKLATDTATGGMPDIVQMDYMYIATYANNDSLADLSGYTSDGTLDVSTIDSALLSSGQINGKLAGIPLSTSLIAITYNPDVLAEAGVEVPKDGWTWDQFKEDSIAIANSTGKYGFSGSPVDDTNFFSYWVRQYGVSLFAEDNKSLGFEDDAITEAFFQYWLDMIEAGAAPNPDEYEQIATLGKEASPVITGDGAYRQDWNNFTTIGASAGNETLQMVTPPVKDASTKALWNKPGMFFCVAETSSVKKECAEFINWFLNSDEANDIMLGERGTPASSTAREHLISSGSLNAQQMDMFNYVTDAAAYCSETPAPDPAGISEINTEFKNIAYSVFYGQSTPAEAAAEFRTQADSILAANN